MVESKTTDKSNSILETLRSAYSIFNWIFDVLVYMVIFISILISMHYAWYNGLENIANIQINLLRITFIFFIVTIILMIYSKFAEWYIPLAKERMNKRRLLFKEELKKEILKEIKNGRSSSR